MSDDRSRQPHGGPQQPHSPNQPGQQPRPDQQADCMALDIGAVADLTRTTPAEGERVN